MFRLSSLSWTSIKIKKRSLTRSLAFPCFERIRISIGGYRLVLRLICCYLLRIAGQVKGIYRRCQSLGLEISHWYLVSLLTQTILVSVFAGVSSLLKWRADKLGLASFNRWSAGSRSSFHIDFRRLSLGEWNLSSDTRRRWQASSIFPIVIRSHLSCLWLWLYHDYLRHDNVFIHHSFGLDFIRSFF